MTTTKKVLFHPKAKHLLLFQLSLGPYCPQRGVPQTPVHYGFSILVLLSLTPVADSAPGLDFAQTP